MCLTGFLLRSLTASADVVLSTVDLTPQQTLALYGTSIPAYYYTGSVWKACTFTYYNNSLDYDPVSPYQTMVTDYDFRDYPAGYASTTDYVNDCIKGMTHLYYVCYLDDVPGIYDNTDLQFSLTPTINISGIAYYRQNINVSRYTSNSTSKIPVTNKLYVSTRFSYAPAPVVSYAMGASGYATYYFRSPVGHINLGSIASCTFANIDIYGQHTDENGNDEIFSVGEQTITINRSVPVVDNSDGNGRYMYVLSISCPRVSDGYVMPDIGGGSGSGSPDYSGQISDINVNIGVTNTLLQQILAKLDLIYASLGVDIHGTVNISSSSISSIGDSIKNLFIPSSSSWTAFRMNMHGLLQSKFSAFFDAEDTVHDFYSSFDNVSPVSSIRFPGVSVALPTGSGSDSAVFSIAAQDVSLKPANEEGKLAPLYECLALIVDFVCTLAFVNMIRTRFFHVIEGGGENDY